MWWRGAMLPRVVLVLLLTGTALVLFTSRNPGPLSLAVWGVAAAVGLAIVVVSRIQHFWCSICQRAWTLRDVAVNGVGVEPYACPVCSGLPDSSTEPTSRGLMTWQRARRAHADFPRRPRAGEIYRVGGPARGGDEPATGG